MIETWAVMVDRLELLKEKLDQGKTAEQKEWQYLIDLLDKCQGQITDQRHYQHYRGVFRMLFEQNILFQHLYKEALDILQFHAEAKYGKELRHFDSAPEDYSIQRLRQYLQLLSA